MTKKRGNCVYSDRIENIKDLHLGKHVVVKYNNMDCCFVHKIRERVMIEALGLPRWNPISGRAEDESVEEYGRYREWLLDRFNNGELYEEGVSL